MSSAKRLIKYLKGHKDIPAITRAICKDASCINEECADCPVYSPAAFKSALKSITVKEVKSDGKS